MREMGPAGDQLHDEVGTFAGKSGLDVLICVGSLARESRRRRRRRECREADLKICQRRSGSRKNSAHDQRWRCNSLKSFKGSAFGVVAKAIEERKRA